MLQRFESFEPRRIKEREKEAKELREKEEQELEEATKRMSLMRTQLDKVNNYTKYRSGRIFLNELKNVTTDESYPGYVMFLNDDGEFVCGYEPKHNTFSVTTSLLDKIAIKNKWITISMIKDIVEKLFDLKGVSIKTVV